MLLQKIVWEEYKLRYIGEMSNFLALDFHVKELQPKVSDSSMTFTPISWEEN